MRAASGTGCNLRNVSPNQRPQRKSFGAPTGNRTPVSAVKGRLNAPLLSNSVQRTLGSADGLPISDHACLTSSTHIYWTPVGHGQGGGRKRGSDGQELQSRK